MALPPGCRLGPYEILAAIGVGGMGEVYRARDTKLNRDVAIKVLPPTFWQDRERLARFQREAQVLAAPNHPNIATIHGTEESGGVRALVMELVEGPTLAERIAKKSASDRAIPLDEALTIAREMAEAIEYAHEKGVIHRDLKPANIKLAASGAVKVLDFGLAKALANDLPSGADLNSPTLSIAATQTGVILGTAAYMSPEQAKGQAADRRSDIWAFGLMLLEMLTGSRLYAGNNVAETLALVMVKDPALDTLPADVPPAIQRLLRRCLQKDPRRRLQAIGEARITIEDVLSGTPPETPLVPAAPAPGARPSIWMAATALLGILLLFSLTVIIFRFREAPRNTATVQFLLPAPENTTFRQMDSPVVSPNGEYVAFPAADVAEGGIQPGVLRVRTLSSLATRDFSGTEGAWMPFWSPDSRFIGFFVNGKLKKVEVSGGAPQTVCDTVSAASGAWSPDGTIIIAHVTGPLFRVPALGGEEKPLTSLNPQRQESLHARPSFLPDGRHFLYLATSAKPDNNGVFAGSLDSPDVNREVKRLISGASNAIYAASTSGDGHLLFERGGALMAQPFDSKKLQLAGNPLPIAEQVAANFYGGSSFSASENGVLAFRVEGGQFNRQLVWFDRSGRQLDVVGEPGDYTNPALSLDGKRLAVGRRDPATKTRDIWVYDLVRKTASRLTFDPADDFNPTWSPDGSRLAFTSDRKGQRNLYQKLASGTGEEELLLESADRKNVEDWSPDGRVLIYNVADGGQGLWMLPLFGDRKPVTLIASPFFKTEGQLSPNGRWIAYRSNESGKNEVYVQAFPPSGGKWQISTTGGGEPAWRRDGRELFYVSATKIFALPVKTEGTAFEAGIPTPLFDAPMVPLVLRNRYVVAANGQRFLVITNGADKGNPPFMVVLNWAARLKH